MTVLKFIETNWSTIALVVTSLGTLWNFLNEKYKSAIRAPFTKKRDEIEIESKKLEFVQQLTAFQDEKLSKILAENLDLMARIEQQNDMLRLADEKNMINASRLAESTQLLKKATNQLNYYKKLLLKNNIEHD